MDGSQINQTPGPPSLLGSQMTVKQSDKTQEIPPEIMSKIFTLVWSSVVPIPRTDYGYPWILGNVNSRWREILWSTRSIWNRINIRFNSRECGYGDALSYILSKIPGPVSLGASVQGTSGSVVRVILEHPDRFSELTISGLNLSSFISLTNLPTTAFPQLEKFFFSPFGFHGDIPELTRSPLETAPKLRCVEYMMWDSTYIPVLLLLPWATIQNIKIGTMHIPHNVVWDIFRSSPVLVSCCLCVDSETTISTTPEIVLPTLEMLNLDTEDEFDWDSFLSPIVAPSLTSLTLASPYLPCPPLASLVIHSRCPLLTLDLSATELNTRVDDADVELLLDHLSSVTNLTIPWPMHPSIFRKIQAGALPDLETAEFSVYADGLEAFLDMIDSYMAFPQRRFSYFNIVCHEGPGLAVQRDRYLAGYEVYSAMEGLEIRVVEWVGFLEIRPPRNNAQ